jgi:chromosome partitioning protein
MKIAIFNQKGGVGKTTTALNLAAAIGCQSGKLPLILDMDPQGHLTHIAGKTPAHLQDSLFGFYQDNIALTSLAVDWPGIGRLVPAHAQLVRADTVFGKGPDTLFKLAQALRTLAEPTDVIIDCSPHLGVLSLAALFAADLVLVPVSADHISANGARQCARTLKIMEPVVKRKLLARYLITRFDSRRRMCTDIFSSLRDELGEQVCTTVIPENVALAESPALGQDIFTHAPQSVGATCYARLYTELFENMAPHLPHRDLPCREQQASIESTSYENSIQTSIRTQPTTPLSYHSSRHSFQLENGRKLTTVGALLNIGGLLKPQPQPQPGVC